MNDLERFEFIVPGYTPETMPLDRLMEYLGELSIILGQASEMHLIEIQKSSTKPVLVMPHAVAVNARNRVSEVRQGGGSGRRRQAYDRIRRLVSEDGGKSAILQAKEGKLLEFKKIDLGEDQVVHALRQETSVEGELIRIGGQRDYAQLLVQERSGMIVAGCTAPRELAAKIGRYLYQPLRLHGIASWQRTGTGRWEITRLQVQSFEALDDDELDDVVVKLRNVKANWPADSTEQLLSMRGGAA